MENWKREFIAHSYIPEDEIIVADGSTKPCGKKLKNPSKQVRLAQLNTHKMVTIINTETVSNKDAWNAIKVQDWDMLIVDESHRFKSFDGVRSKNLHVLSRKIKYKLILTGSPILQNAMDLWSQFYILDPDILGDNFYSFRGTYFFDKNAGMPSHKHFPDWQPRKGSENDLNKTIYKHADRVMKDDVLDLPPRTYQTLEVPMSKEQSRIYKEMRDHLVAFIENPVGGLDEEIPDIDQLPEMMKADLAIVKTLRLQQLICGVFTTSEGEIKHIKTEREKILKDLLVELTANHENKIIIWTVFTPTYDVITDILEDLEIKYCMLTGRQSKDEKQRSVDTFNKAGGVSCLVANQAAGGTGVNLTAANYEVYYSRSFVLEHDLQADARAYRGGQDRKTTRIDLVTPDTMDSKVVESLAQKRKGAEDILAVRNNELSRKEILGMI